MAQPGFLTLQGEVIAYVPWNKSGQSLGHDFAPKDILIAVARLLPFVDPGESPEVHLGSNMSRWLRWRDPKLKPHFLPNIAFHSFLHNEPISSSCMPQVNTPHVRNFGPY